MNMDFEKLLTPISTEKPCGRDISDEADFYMLVEIAKGKQETQFSKGEPPNWNEVIELALTLFGQSKDLWIAYYIACGVVNLHGDEGMVKGIDFIQRLIEKFWDLLTPPLDKESDLPAFQRINIVKDLLSLTGPFAEGIRNITLTKSGMGSFNYNDILAITQNEQSITDKIILATILDSNKEFVAKLKGNFKKTEEIVKALNDFLKDKGIDTEFEKAFTSFLSMIKSIEKYLDTNADMIKEKQTLPTDKAETSIEPNNTGDISSYQDIIRMIKKICKWYEENEPSSPVPLFLIKAESLIGKSFVDIVNDVAASAMKDIALLFKTQNKQETTNAVVAAATKSSPDQTVKSAIKVPPSNK